MSKTNRVRVWGGRLGASVVGVLVAVVASVVLLPLLGQVAGAVVALGIGILVARALGR